MTHRFPIKEIAAQSGLSTATVDRVLNRRAHVSSQTRARVGAAIEELEAQAGQLAARGRQLFIDVIVEAPLRFCRELRAGAESALPKLRPVVLRPRFTMADVMTTAQMTAILARIARRGSHGVCLKARDTGPVREGIDRLMDRGIPVVTLMTDCPGSRRMAYVGLNNRRAGETAAQLMARHVQSGRVLTLQSQRAFEGEEERLRGFAGAMAIRAPGASLFSLRDSGGLDTDTGAAVERALTEHGTFDGIYSMGGGNRAALAALTRAGQGQPTYIAHDLDRDNLGLLEREALSYVLHHDLESDMQDAFRQIMAYHKLVAPVATVPSDVQIIVAGNVPHRYRQK